MTAREMQATQAGQVIHEKQQMVAALCGDEVQVLRRNGQGVSYVSHQKHQRYTGDMSNGGGNVGEDVNEQLAVSDRNQRDGGGRDCAGR
jgi:hypothetical protein